MGLSFMFPSLSSLSIPCLVFAGLCYGLGVGPVSFVLMSSLYPQKMKSAGVAASQTMKAVIVLIQLKGLENSTGSNSILIQGFSSSDGNDGPQWGLLHRQHRQHTRRLLLLPRHSRDEKQVRQWAGEPVPEAADWRHETTISALKILFINKTKISDDITD